MLRLLKALLILFSLWLLTGITIVGGNERAVLRRFGRAVTAADGTILLRTNGLYLDWPWPITQVDRISLTEVRTLSVPVAPTESSQLLADETLPRSTYLTGDKNLLDVRLTVHYRIAEAGVRAYLFGSVSIEDRLMCLVESVAADRLAQSGVDFVQVSGLAELRGELARLLQEHSDRQTLGILIEDVILDEVAAPVAVKADFLDVANARADREQTIQAALSDAEQRKQSASAEARRIRDAALSQAQETLLSAQGSAARFQQIIASFQNPESPGTTKQPLARRLALEQQYFQAVAEILEKIQGKVLLDTGQEVDLTIWQKASKKTSESNGTDGAASPQPSVPQARD
jgi:membrane protease subunit HflK